MRQWTAEEEALLRQLREQQPPVSWTEVARSLGRTKASVRGKWRFYMGGGRRTESEEFDIEPAELSELAEEVANLLKPQLDRIEPEEPASWLELTKLASETQEAMETVEPARDIRVVRLPGEPPPIIQYVGDIHFGHRATRYTDWIYAVMMLLRSPNTCMICLGDLSENVRSFRYVALVISQVLPPKLQAQAIVSVVTELVEKGKLLALTGGTHDLNFDERIAGQAILGWLYEKHKQDVAFFRNKGLLKVQLYYDDGTEKEYPNLLFHKSRYRSFLTTLHSNRREYQLTFPGKVVAGAHDHEPGAEMYWHYGLLEKAGYDIGGWSWNIKVGPFTAADNQLRDYSSFFQPTELFCPAAVYTKRGIVLLPTLRDALAFRAGLGAASRHEEKVVAEMEITDRQREELWKHIKREYGEGEQYAE